MFNRKYLHQTLCFLFAISTLLSCGKRDDLDALKVKVSDGTVSYVQGGDMVSLNGKNYNFTNSKVGVAINLKEASKSGDTVLASVDPSLVADYNSVHLEKNPQVPEGAFTVVNGGRFPVQAGTAVAADSLYVLLNNGAALKDKTTYLVPVRLSSKQGAKLKYSIFYFKILVRMGSMSAKMNEGIVNGSQVYRITGGALNMTLINVFPDSLKFRVLLNSIFPAHETYVEASVLNDTQTDSVSRARGFGALPFPADTYSLSKSVVKIGTTSKLSTDSITLRFKNRANFKSFQYYLIGIKLKHYKQSEYGIPPVPNDSSSAYIRLFLF